MVVVVAVLALLPHHLSQTYSNPYHPRRNNSTMWVAGVDQVVVVVVVVVMVVVVVHTNAIPVVDGTLTPPLRISTMISLYSCSMVINHYSLL